MILGMKMQFEFVYQNPKGDYQGILEELVLMWNFVVNQHN